MTLDALFDWLETTQIAQFMQVSPWAFPTVEAFHVMAISVVVGVIAAVDLRLLGFAFGERPIRQMLSELLPFVWIAFVAAVATGSLMFVTSASSYAHNQPFISKMVCLAYAGVNMLVFEFGVLRSVKEGDLGRPGWGARLSGGFSICIWIAIVSLGRWIGFTKIG